MLALNFIWMESPVGRLKLLADDAALLAVLWDDEQPIKRFNPVQQHNPRHPILCLAAQQLTEYFTGQRQSFDVPLSMIGTDFQKQVWAALQQIPYATTCSYLDIAQAIDNPKAVRAVGAANGKNPLSIIVPCHRVIGKNGTLIGFGGGLDNKKTLLSLEQRFAR